MANRKIYILVEHRNGPIYHGAYRSDEAASLAFEQLLRSSLAAPTVDLSQQRLKLQTERFVQIESNCYFKIEVLDSPY